MLKEEIDITSDLIIPKKWKLIVFYKNRKTQYAKRIFNTEKEGHEYYKFMTKLYPIAAKKISSYIVMPIGQNQ